MQEARFQLNIRKSFLSVRAVRQWNQLPREVVGSPTLEASKRRLDRNHIDVAVYDAMFMLHTLKFPETYGALARKLLEHISSSTPAKEVYLVFDTYGYQSIIDCEHEWHTTVPSSDIRVTGADPKTPKKAVDALQNEQFKTSFTSFLCNEWKIQK